MEELDAGFVLWDEHNQFVHCNSYFRELLGSKSEFLLPGMRFEDFIRQNEITTSSFNRLDKEKWISSRLEDMEKDHIDYEYKLSNGRWFRVYKIYKWNKIDECKMQIFYNLSNVRFRVATSTGRRNTCIKSIYSSAPQPNLQRRQGRRGWRCRRDCLHHSRRFCVKSGA